MFIARWNHTEPIPNSEVKRCCGDDSLGVALRQNSSMPGLILNKTKITKSLSESNLRQAFYFLHVPVALLWFYSNRLVGLNRR